MKKLVPLRASRLALIVSLITLPPLRAACQGGELQQLDVLTKIRDEGLAHSQVMLYASELADGIGSRLTGSPEYERSTQWAIAALRRTGISNARTEEWGDFGLPWTQHNTSLSLLEPAPATLLAQATPWSPATLGAQTASVIRVPRLTDASQFAAYQGRLAGKVLLYGDAPPVEPDPKVPSFSIDSWLQRQSETPLVDSSHREENIQFYRQVAFEEEVARFFAQQHAVAVLRSDGEGAMFHDSDAEVMGGLAYRPQHRQALPSAVISPDAFGRIDRLLARGVAVRVSIAIDTTLGERTVPGENVLADLPGTDPRLGKEVVLFGGHLDSWVAGTGATDNGAGVVIALEAMRILEAIHLQPRRTIRIALWGGEEQGSLGSRGYVERHFAHVTYVDDTQLHAVPMEFWKVQSVVRKPDFDNLDVYFNTDHGDSRFYGILAQGNMAAAEVFRSWLPHFRDLGFSVVSLRREEQTDHVSFAQVSLPGFSFLQAPRQDARTHHTNLDTYERLSEPDLKQAGIVMASFVYLAAQRGERIPRPPVATDAVSETTSQTAQQESLR